MKPFKILYIEHEPDREITEQAIESVHGIEVKTITSTDFLDDTLKKEHFDLVITDTTFLPEDQMHLEEDMDGVYLLKDIVNSIRSIDNQRIRIAVLTHFSPTLLQEYQEDLEKVDYIWDKSAAIEDFITWQINRIKSDAQRQFPGQKIITALNELLEKSRFIEYEWNIPLKEMINEFSNYFREKEQIYHAKEKLKDLATMYGIGSEIKKLLNNMDQSEIFNIAGKPSAWGHLKHVLYVYWLGFYLINSVLLNIDIFSRKICDENEQQKQKFTKINLAWFLTALLHDIGIFAERLENIFKRTKKLVDIYPENIYKIDFKYDHKIFEKSSKKYLAQLKSLIDRELAEWFNETLSDKYFSQNHGILSAITILKHFGENKDIEKLIENASRAAALHNIIQPRSEEEKEKMAGGYKEPPNLNWKEHPFDCLLILCDQLQIWDRQTGQEELYGEFPLETVELSDIDIDSENNLKIVLNYLPFRYITPENPYYDKLKNKIRDILIDNTIETLNKIKDDDFTSNIKVEFIFDGRYQICEWPSTTP